MPDVACLLRHTFYSFNFCGLLEVMENFGHGRHNWSPAQTNYRHGALLNGCQHCGATFLLALHHHPAQRTNTAPTAKKMRQRYVVHGHCQEGKKRNSFLITSLAEGPMPVITAARWGTSQWRRIKSMKMKQICRKYYLPVFFDDTYIFFPFVIGSEATATQEQAIWR